MVGAAETAALRREVLRPHWTLAQVLAAADDAPHLAVYDDGVLVACASIRPEPMPGDPRAGDWRLRGMASEEAVRGRGHGATALAAALGYARERGATRVWCNARTGALCFYVRHGFTVVGEEFELPDAGPHYLAFVAS